MVLEVEWTEFFTLEIRVISFFYSSQITTIKKFETNFILCFYDQFIGNMKISLIILKSGNYTSYKLFKIIY
jgi:hypothetical protein